MIRRLVVAEGALAAAGVLILDPERAHYLRDVLRLKAGAEIELLDGAGLEVAATVAEVDRKQVKLRWTAPVARRPRPEGPEITLLQALAKGDKIDAVVRDATEIVPLHTARAVVERAHRLERWRSIAEDAVRVSDRPLRPEIEAPLALEAALLRPRSPLALVLAGESVLGLGAALRSFGLDRLSTSAVELLIGPEGGLAAEEQAAAVARGFTAVSLGPHTLRTETAGPAALAIVLHAGGVLGGRSGPRERP